MNKTCITILFTALVGIPLFSASDYRAQMEKVLAQEAHASTFEEVKGAADALAEISKTHEGQWESLYWASFVYSQVWVFGQSRENGKYLDMALAYYEMADRAHPNRSAEDQAEFEVLKALLFGLKSYFYRSGERPAVAALFNQVSDRALLRAAKADPKNPRVAMMQSIDTFNNPATREKGIDQMKAALKNYDRFQLANPISPNWGKSFIEFRLNRLKQQTP